MCGIVAILRPRGLRPAESDTTLTAMRDAVAHRGPDDGTSEIVDGWAALGHRRLAIIDVGGSRQPLHSEQGDVSVVFNGEIYNFTALRSELRARGHHFATHGDGEVIVHGYQEWGADIAARLEGMFTFVLVDRAKRRALCARDRFGIKPLFYTATDGAILIASELKSILAHPAVRRVACGVGLRLGGGRMHVPWPLTAFDGVYRVAPGALIDVDAEGFTVRRFAPMVSAPEQPADDGEALDRLRAAVRRQMIADVPVGAFLSGGIDSTLVVALMRQLTSAPIHTFSVSVERDDESAVAAETARRLGTIHHTVRISTPTFEELVDLPALYDEPFAETSAIGVRALSQLAREHVKVALSGDGGDEVFGGYDAYRYVAAVDRLQRRVPHAIAGAVGGAATRALRARRWPDALRRALRAASLFGRDPVAMTREVVSQSWATGESSDAEALSDRILALASSRGRETSAIRLAMIADRLERLPNAMLQKVDIASMAESLEVRVPLLDDELVRWADALPVRALRRRRYGKYVLRNALEKLLPNGSAWAPKRGFALPIDVWLRRAQNARAIRELLHDERRCIVNLTGTDAVNELRAFEAGKSVHAAGTAAMRLQWFACVALWARRFGIVEANHEPISALDHLLAVDGRAAGWAATLAPCPSPP